MKRRRRYGEKYSGLPYPEKFKDRMMVLWPGDQDLEKALAGGWDSIGIWFDELCNCGPAKSATKILDCLARGEIGISELKKWCEGAIRRRKELKALSDEWQRIVYLDDQSCKPWKEEK